MNYLVLAAALFVTVACAISSDLQEILPVGFEGSAVAVEKNLIYIVGQTTVGIDAETAKGGTDLFVICFNSTYGRLWTKIIGNSRNQFASDIAIRHNIIFVTGTTLGPVDSEAYFVSYDAFLMKLSLDGSEMWVVYPFETGDNVNDEAFEIYFETGNNYLWLSGQFSDYFSSYPGAVRIDALSLETFGFFNIMKEGSVSSISQGSETDCFYFSGWVADIYDFDGRAFVTKWNMTSNEILWELSWTGQGFSSVLDTEYNPKTDELVVAGNDNAINRASVNNPSRKLYSVITYLDKNGASKRSRAVTRGLQFDYQLSSVTIDQLTGNQVFFGEFDTANQRKNDFLLANRTGGILAQASLNTTLDVSVYVRPFITNQSDVFAATGNYLWKHSLDQYHVIVSGAPFPIIELETEPPVKSNVTFTVEFKRRAPIGRTALIGIISALSVGLLLSAIIAYVVCSRRIRRRIMKSGVNTDSKDNLADTILLENSETSYRDAQSSETYS